MSAIKELPRFCFSCVMKVERFDGILVDESHCESDSHSVPDAITEIERA